MSVEIRFSVDRKSKNADLAWNKAMDIARKYIKPDYYRVETSESGEPQLIFTNEERYNFFESCILTLLGKGYSIDPQTHRLRG